MINRSSLVVPATFVAWIAQAAVATALFIIMVRVIDQANIKGYSGLVAGTMTFFLIIYIPQFLFIFSPVAYLIRRLDQNGLIASILAGVSASLIGIAFNYILLNPFATTGDHFDGRKMIELYEQLRIDTFAVSGGIAAGCGYWLVTNIKRNRGRWRNLGRCGQPFRMYDS